MADEAIKETRDGEQEAAQCAGAGEKRLNAAPLGLETGFQLACSFERSDVLLQLGAAWFGQHALSS